MQHTGLITGASSGIGRALAFEHARRKRDLIIVARRREELQQLANQLREAFGVTVLVLSKDLTLPNAIEELIVDIKSKGAVIEYLFNSAGFGGHGKFHNRNITDDLRMIDLNVKALVELTHHVLQDMIQRGKGKILNVSSTAGYLPGPLQATYFASKAFVNSFSWAVRREIRKTGVSLTTLNPGPVKTAFIEKAALDGTLLFRWGNSPEYTARRGYQAMEKGRRSIITDCLLKVALNLIVPISPVALQLAVIEQLQIKR